MSNNIFDRNGLSLAFSEVGGPEAAWLAFSSAFPMMFDTNTFLGASDQNTVRLLTSLGSGAPQPLPVPYGCRDNLTVAGGETLVLLPCTVIQCSQGKSITVNGDIVAAGTPECPVIFTSSSPKDGVRWGGLRINNKSLADPTLLDSCIIEFAGDSGSPALRLSNAAIDVTSSVISGNGAAGMLLESGSDALVTESAIVSNLGDGVSVDETSDPTVMLGSIFDNGGSGMAVSCPVASELVDAASNYWGDDSGPPDNSDDSAQGGLYNPGGLGDEVSDCVGYDPWIRMGPSVEGEIVLVSGDGQTGMVGTVLPEPLVVEVRSTLGNPIEGIEVIFSVVEGEATVEEGQPIVTGSDGQAAATVRLGLVPGDITVAVTARDVNSPLAVFRVAAGEGVPALFGMRATPLVLDVRRKRKGQPGDVNGDGKVTNTDGALIAGVLAGVLEADEWPVVSYSRSGDINGDGRIDRGDVWTIQGYIVGLVPSKRR